MDGSREWRGGQRQLFALARAQGERCAVVVVDGAPLGVRLREAGVAVLPIPGRMPRALFGLRQAIRRWGPQLVAAHDSRAHSWAALARPPVPLVVHRRVDFALRRRSRVKYRVPAGYVAVSGAVARVLRQGGVPDERVVVVHDGVDPIPTATGPREPVVGCAGALVAHKDHATFVDACGHLVASGWEGRAVIAGEGPLRSALAARIEVLGLSRRVRLLGHREDVRARIGRWSVFCHPSCEEGMGQVVVEAMLAGTPVVATRAGGVPVC